MEVGIICPSGWNSVIHEPLLQVAPKGHLILKCLFDVFNSFQKLNENKFTWGIIIIKWNLLDLEETAAWQNYFKFVLPLADANQCNFIALSWCFLDSVKFRKHQLKPCQNTMDHGPYIRCYLITTKFFHSNMKSRNAT